MSEESNYEPFGPDWEKAMMRIDKKGLISLLKSEYMKNQPNIVDVTERPSPEEQAKRSRSVMVISVNYDGNTEFQAQCHGFDVQAIVSTAMMKFIEEGLLGM